jgi:hypothetical protein
MADNQWPGMARGARHARRGQVSATASDPPFLHLSTPISRPHLGPKRHITYFASPASSHHQPQSNQHMALSLPFSCPSLHHVAVVVALFIVGCPGFYVLCAFLWPLFLPSRVVPGPDKPHWFKGHMDMSETNTGDSERKWMAIYGHVFKFRGFFNVSFRHFICPLSLIWLLGSPALAVRCSCRPAHLATSPHLCEKIFHS